MTAFDGTRMGTLGPVLAVGDVAPGGDAPTVVDVDPADAALRRQVLVYWSGRRRRLTSPPAGMTDGAPRWAPDDSWMSFVRSPIGADRGKGRVWLVPAEGGDARPLAIAATAARWLP